MAPHSYLLEVGTEELPASFLKTAVPELRTLTEAALDKQNLAHGEITVFHTPRRLALFIENLADAQPAYEELLKGPPAKMALDADGKHTPAALGFAKKNGIEASALTTETLDGTDYLVYRKQSTGRPVTEILPEILPETVLKLTGSHFMSWDPSGIKFSRPIRWLVSVLDDKALPLTIGSLTASSPTPRALRFRRSQNMQTN